jgi:hypothetical protein
MDYYCDSTKSLPNLDLNLGAIKDYVKFQPDPFKKQFKSRYPVPKAALMRTLLADGAFGHEQPLPYDVHEIIEAGRE